MTSLGTPRYVDGVRAWIVKIPEVAMERAQALLPADVQRGAADGLLALSDVCPADKIQLKYCRSSGWFECPGCGSRFDGLGHKTGGPAPRGLTFHPVQVDGGDVVVSPRPLIDGLPIDRRIVEHRAQGTHCA
ncbi:MAG TPA: hypothetical protein VM345_14765 [Acidimicrobiales bacterium]|nr:hypothetical protein [Acidimicrobiales bacterium]